MRTTTVRTAGLLTTQTTVLRQICVPRARFYCPHTRDTDSQTLETVSVTIRFGLRPAERQTTQSQRLTGMLTGVRI